MQRKIAKMKHPYLLPLLQQLDENTQRVRGLFDGLNSEQLNWKPAPDSWSVGQCLDHLLVGNKKYFDLFRSLASQAYKPSLWAKISPFSASIGKMLLNGTTPDATKKMKAPKVFQPSQSTISADIVSRFLDHQSELKGLMERMDMWADHRVVIASPAASMLTYQLDTCLTIIVQHETRHINQAERVLNHAEFPRD